MTGSIGGGRRPVVYWTVCPECFTYIWAEGVSITNEDDLDCPYCEESISLLGGSELSENCRKIQQLLEEVERQIATLPAAVDVHRFFSEQVDFISQAFNDRLDDIQHEKDFRLSELEAPPAG